MISQLVFPLVLSAFVSMQQPVYEEHTAEPIVLTIESTAYCYGKTTATGKKVREGYAAMATEYLGKTAVIYDAETFEYIGIFEIEDTGSDKRIQEGKCIDIYNPSKDWCLEYGRRNVIVFLYDAKG